MTISLFIMMIGCHFLYGMKLHKEVNEDFVEKDNAINSTEIYNANNKIEYKIETYRKI